MILKMLKWNYFWDTQSEASKRAAVLKNIRKLNLEKEYHAGDLLLKMITVKADWKQFSMKERVTVETKTKKTVMQQLCNSWINTEEMVMIIIMIIKKQKQNTNSQWTGQLEWTNGGNRITHGLSYIGFPNEKKCYQVTRIKIIICASFFFFETRSCGD